MSLSIAGIDLTRRLAAFAAVATWLLIVVGGIVRVSGSGMGCPDWPHCYGGWIPPLDPAAWIEMIHRYSASVVSLLVAATVVAAWRSRREAPSALRAATAAVLLIAVQIGIGAWTVFTGNRGDTVIAHLVAALLLLGATVWTAVRAQSTVLGRGRRTEMNPTRQRLASLAIAMVPLTLVLAAVGGAVQVTNGGFACPAFPHCGAPLTTQLAGGTVGLMPAIWHMLHRILALVLGALIVVGTVSAMKVDRSPVRGWLSLVLGLYGIQVVVGVGQVLSGMPDVLRWAHLALGAALWGAVMGYAASALDGYSLRAPELRRYSTGGGLRATSTSNR